ncbi:hypothetical protein [Adonisia turfae]|uniref:Uncharacterized protein n=1 Tax=Adonisia turfae CCMR0081 TaxID=2292702 RepID=A0A6M0RH04_9CYAN|nr:hypothetical protein [Adonisia turfae]NEZ55465.1 hypothetical protein [Adonisia turfae CCMR0081]
MESPRIIARTYRNKKGDEIQLPFDRTTGEVELYDRWWDSQVLTYLGIVQQSSTKRLPTPKPLPFGNPAKYQGRFTTTRVKGSSEGTGAYI